MDQYEYMNRALVLANEALEAQEVPVGCVFVVGDEIVAEARNTVNITHNPTKHAEMNCVDHVLNQCKLTNTNYNEYFRKIKVFVTVEPCIMCAAALHELNVKEVIYGCCNDRFGGKTVLDVSTFFEHGYKISGNIFATEAMDLLKKFYKGSNPNAPESKVKKKKDNPEVNM